MLRYVVYLLMFAVLGAVLYVWGLKKAQNQSVELARSLYKKCERLVYKELKKKESLQRKDVEELVANVRVGQFYSKNKMGVTNPREFSKAFLEYMIKNNKLDEQMKNGKKVYSLKK